MSLKTVSKETEVSKLTLVAHSFLLKITFLPEDWKIVNVTPFFKLLQGIYKTMSMISELGKSGEIIIKHEISGHMNKYDTLENKIIYAVFL